MWRHVVWWDWPLAWVCDLLQSGFKFLPRPHIPGTLGRQWPRMWRQRTNPSCWLVVSVVSRNPRRCLLSLTGTEGQTKRFKAVSFAFISVLESSLTLRTPSSWKKGLRDTPVVSGPRPFLRFCSTEPLSLGLKDLAHMLLFLGLNFLLACPTNTSAQQARSCQWCPQWQVLLGLPEF